MVYTYVRLTVAYTRVRSSSTREEAPIPEDPKKEARRAQIEAAAFEVLAEKGYRSTSMLQIAKRAQASNQTLYAWYGNKQTLFRSIIEDNGRAVRRLLEDALDDGEAPLATLEALGPLLLRFTTDEKAIIINRAAIADANETGLLAEAIDEMARTVIFALICALMARLVADGLFRPGTDADEAAGIYVSLLFGETQFRQALGTMEPLDEAQVQMRAQRAFALTCQLYQSERQRP